MKHHALEFLVCPTCHGDLGLQVELEEGSEIMAGWLSCRPCARDYPIVRGVPRFVDQGLYASSFGYQWNRFREVQLDSRNGTRESERTLFETTGWSESDYRGRLVLDAGVGAGRFAEVVARHGGEVVGIDLTEAVDAAWANIGSHERVHIVQADIFSMPFRDARFDLAYSVGVLHHTPDTRAAFDRVAAKVGPDGGLAVFIYHGYGPSNRFSDLYRRVTTRLPTRLMLAAAWMAVPLYPLYRAPLLGSVLRIVAPMSVHHDARWRWLDTFDWYTPKFQWKHHYPEVFRWFKEAGFAVDAVFDEPIRMRGTRTRHAETLAKAPVGRSGGKVAYLEPGAVRASRGDE